jgi:hypothetical protein
MRGICCQCQTAQPIKQVQELDDFGEEGYTFVMMPHEAWGQECEGEGTVPQAILQE